MNLRVKNLNLENFTRAPPQVELLQVRLIILQAEGNYSSRHAAFFRKSFSSHQKGNYEHRNFVQKKLGEEM